MATLSKIGIGKYMRTLATASLLAMAVITIPSTQAYALDNNGSQTANKKCVNPDTGVRDIESGTVWTSTTQNGQVASRYKCNGSTGNWDRMARFTPSGPRAPMGPRVFAH